MIHGRVGKRDKRRQERGGVPPLFGTQFLVVSKRSSEEGGSLVVTFPPYHFFETNIPTQPTSQHKAVGKGSKGKPTPHAAHPTRRERESHYSHRRATWLLVPGTI